MKKRYIALAFIGLILGYTAKTNYWFEDERDVFFPITKEQLRAKVRSKVAEKNSLPDTAASNITAPSLPSVDASGLVDISRLGQSILFNEIYNNKVLQDTRHQETYFNMIKSRLASPYPDSKAVAHGNQYEREVANRLGLLRAMMQFWGTPRQTVGIEPLQIKKFFYEIAKNKNENIMVRRQAYKNWLVYGDSATQSEKTRLATTSDARLLHLVSFSDESLIETLTESAE